MKRISIILYAILITLLPHTRTWAAGYVGTAPIAGNQYYLYNVYQSKFLSYGNSWGTQVSLSNNIPLCCTLESNGNGFFINTHYSLETNGWKNDVTNYIIYSEGLPYVNARWGSSDTNYNDREATKFAIVEADEGFYLDCADGALMFGSGTACVVGNRNEGFNADKSLWRFVTETEYAEMTQKNHFIVAAMNVDGMPRSVKIAGVYDLSLNPDGKEAEGATSMGQKMKTMGYDFIAASEDFNYNDEIMAQIGDIYNQGTHRGGIEVTLSTYAKYLAKETLFDTDGLNFFWKKSLGANNESWTAWNEHYGYTDNEADGLINKGYRYFKLDFVTNGIMEADRYYNPEVHTGVEAYNEGFAYFVKQVDKFDVPVFIDLSIAPLFPYHYANGRRQACDTWGTIGWTEYSMNAITAGWWTNGLYQYNDPDGLPMVGHGDQGSTTLAENRSRLTNGIVSGHVLLADNFSVTNSSGRGNPELSRTRANSLFTNADINAMLALDPNFRPVYGYNEYNGSSSGAEATVMMTTDEYFYVVVFNYNSSINAANITGTIPLDILGFTKDDFSSVKELWFGTTEEIKDGLSYNIPSRDCRVYRFTRTKPDAIGQVEKVESEQITIESQGNQFIVHSQLPIRRVSCYDLAGRRMSLKNEDSYQTTLPVPTKKGVVIVSVTLSNGKTYNKKLKL